MVPVHCDIVKRRLSAPGCTLAGRLAGDVCRCYLVDSQRAVAGFLKVWLRKRASVARTFGYLACTLLSIMEVTSSALVECPADAQQDSEHVRGDLRHHIDRPNEQDAVTVEVKVTNITRQDLDLLEHTLSEWVLWHRRTYQQGYPPDIQLLTGSIGLNAEHFREDRPVGWVDKLRKASATKSIISNGAAQYEQVEAPPLYDRAVSELLAPAPAVSGSGINMLPGGSEATKRRARAEACYVSEGKDSPASAQVAVKRQKLSESRCYNCGSYAHGLADCTKPLDQERISAARAEQAASRCRPTGFMSNFFRHRYFDASLNDKTSGADTLKPGCISSELAEALGMTNNLAPPPWLSRMAVLGLPPRYLVVKEAGLKERMEFILGSEEEDDKSAQGTESAAVSSRSDASSDLPDQQDATDADFVPIGIDAVQKQQCQADGNLQDAQLLQLVKQPAVAQEQQPGSHHGTVSQLQVDDQHGVEAVQQPPAAVEVVEGPEANSAQHIRYTHPFPGINAAIPESADAAAWRAELDKAARLSRLMGCSH